MKLVYEFNESKFLVINEAAYIFKTLIRFTIYSTTTKYIQPSYYLKQKEILFVLREADTAITQLIAV